MRRWFYVLAGSLALLVVAAVGALETMKSEMVRIKIASALSSALGQPVAIGGLAVSLLPVPSLSARQVRIGGADSTAAPGVFLAGLRVVPRLRSLLPGQALTIQHADLTGLVISVRRDSAGHWLLPVPSAPVTDTGVGAAGKTAPDVHELRIRDGAIRIVDDRQRSRSGRATATMITDVAARMQAVAGSIEVPRFTGRLGETVVTGSIRMGPTGAELTLRSASIQPVDLATLFALAGMAPSPSLSIGGKAPFVMTISVAPGFASYTVTGKAAIEHVALGTLSLEGVEAPFHVERGVLTLDPFTFTAYGGHQQGAVAVDFNHPAAIYSIRTSLQGLDVSRALSATTAMQDFLSGRARVSGTVRGSGHTVLAMKHSLAGTVAFELDDGVLRNFPLLAAANQVLGITEGTARDTKFQRLSGTATIGGGRVRTDDLVLHAGKLRLTGKGTLGFDRSLDFHAIASFSTAMSTQVVQPVGPPNHRQSERGGPVFPVRVTGTTTAPKIAIDVGAMAKKQFGGAEKALRKLLQRH